MLTGEPIIVLEACQSGASLVCEALEKMGAYLGAGGDFVTPNENDLGGCHEIRALRELNLRGYPLFGMTFSRSDRLPSDWQQTPGSKTFMEEVRALLRSKFSGQQIWALDGTAILGLIPIYREIFASEGLAPRFAICICHPLRAAKSEIERRHKLDYSSSEGQMWGLEPPIGEHAIGTWLQSTFSALRDTRGAIREVISCESLVADGESGVRRLSDRLLSVPATEEQIRSATERIRHEGVAKQYSTDDLKTLPELVGRVYDCCLRITQDGDGFNDGSYDHEIETLWTEFSQMGRMIRPIQLPSGQMIVSWRQGNKPSYVALKYSPTGSWQTLRLPASIPANSMVQIDPYQMPCQIWIRKAVWRSAGGEQTIAVNAGQNGLVENLFGIKRLTVFGPGAVVTQAPAGAASAEIELEIQVQAGNSTLNGVVGLLRGVIEQTRIGSRGPGMQGARR